MSPTGPHDELRASRHALEQLDARLEQVVAERSAAQATLRAAQLAGDQAAIDQSAQQILDTERELPRLRLRATATEEAIDDLRRALYPSPEATFDDLESSQSILLLPVRLETRFAWQDLATDELVFGQPSASTTPVLLVRIYPDDVHLDSHRRAITSDEDRWRHRFRARLDRASDRQHFVEAWRELLGEVPAPRAAWLADPRAGPVLAGAATWQTQATARLMPDRWIAVAWTDQGTVSAGSELVAEVLPVAPDPSGARGGLDDPQLRWLWEFQTALNAGMALRVPLPATGSGAAPSVERLVVFGVRASDTPSEAAAGLTALLDAHHYTDGLAFLLPGTPTNNTPDARVVHTSRPDAAHVFEVEGDMAPLRPHRTLVDDPASDGAQAAILLGVDRSVFGHVEGADRLAHRLGAGVFVRMILARAVEPTVRRLLGPRVADPGADADVDQLVQFLFEHVSGVGPIPVMRVGNQPYGILPVTLLRAGDADLQAFFALLTDHLDRLRAVIWEPAVQQVPRIGGPHPSGHVTKLLDILRTDGAAANLWARLAAPRQLARAVLGARGASMATLRADIIGLLSQLGVAVTGRAVPEIADSVFLTDPAPLDLPFATPADSTDPEAVSRGLELVALARLSLADFNLVGLAIGEQGTGRPQTVLLAMARLAVLAAADRACRRLLASDGLDRAVIEAWDRDVTTSADALAAFSERLNAQLSSAPGQPLHLLLLNTGGLTEAEPLQQVLGALRTLARPYPGAPDATHQPGLLDTIVRSELGVASHRLDAWYTGLATRRLLNARANQPTGTYVGAWGVLEDLTPKALAAYQGTLPPGATGKVFTDPTNAGFVHAPSASHATAAAVLRCAHLAHHADLDGAAFSIDLSSRRVRRARWLLDGIRNGQPLGALVGYQVERNLKRTAPQLIDVVRRAAPLVANKLTSPAGPAENVAAGNVVDGLALLTKAGYGTSTSVSASDLQTVLGLTDLAEARVVETALLDALDAVDATADLLLADSVFQQVQGNPARAGGAVDSISGAPVAPVQPDIARATRTGVAGTHRLCVALPSDDTALSDEPAGWAATNRARTEPALERWARATLPDPAVIVIPVAVTDSEKTTYTQVVLAELHQAVADGSPLGSFRISAVDFVHLADPEPSAAGQPLEERLLTMFRNLGGTPATATLRTLPGRPTEADAIPAGGWTPELFSLTEAIEIAHALRQVIDNARALRAGDLVPLGTTPAHTTTLDGVENRLTAAEQALGQLRTDLGTPSQDVTTLHGRLAAADSFGLANCLLPLGSTPAASSARVVDDLNRVCAAVAKQIQDRLDLSQQVAVTSVETAQQRAEALFGRGFIVLPELSPAGDTPVPLDPAATPDGADTASARQFLARSASVRAAASRLDRHLTYAEALEADAPTLTVTQLPFAAGDRWIALGFDPTTEEPLAGRVALVAHQPLTHSSTITGLLLDEWVETTPNRQETTSVTFHYDAPTSAAPNTCLLAVPPPAVRWSPDMLRDTIVEALALARLRTVDPDILDGAGQLLPALWTVENTAGDAASINLLSLLGGA